LGWLVKVVLLCLVVGLFLSFFEIDPAAILTNTWATVLSVGDLVVGVVRWAVPYILVGAVVVVPLALLGVVLRWSRSRRGPERRQKNGGTGAPEPPR